MLHLGLLDHDRNGCSAVSDVAHPIYVSESSQTSCNSLIQAVRHNLNGVFDAVQFNASGPICQECRADLGSRFAIYSPTLSGLTWLRFHQANLVPFLYGSGIDSALTKPNRAILSPGPLFQKQP